MTVETRGEAFEALITIRKDAKVCRSRFDLLREDKKEAIKILLMELMPVFGGFSVVSVLYPRLHLAALGIVIVAIFLLYGKNLRGIENLIQMRIRERDALEARHKEICRWLERQGDEISDLGGIDEQILESLTFGGASPSMGRGFAR